MHYALADTGLWYAMFDHRDPYHPYVDDKVEILDICHLILPWPITYEVLRTRFVRNRLALQKFQEYIKRPDLGYIDDSKYRVDAMALALSSSLDKQRPLSMVDCLLRLLLDDINVKIDCFATFNTIDFADLCATRNIEMI